MAVDDHPSLLGGLTIVFGATADLELVATARSAEAGLQAAREHQPDVMLIDVRLPGTTGIEAVAGLRAASRDSGAVMYSAYGDRRTLADAIAAGARGYVMKASPVPDLLRAIRTVAEGGAYVDPALSPLLLIDSSSPDAPLPEREREILQLLAEGLRTEEVATRIGLSAETVKSDTKRAVQRLGASGRVEAVAIALRQSYIT